jgi:hypothetical protein
MTTLKVTVQIEATANDEASRRELESVLGRLLRLSEARSSNGEPAGATEELPDDGEPAVNPSQWTFRSFEQLWELLSPGARRVLTELARKPSGYPDRELEAALGMDIQTIGGYLASVGRRKAQFLAQEPVYRKDATTGWQFVLAPDVAGYIKVLADAASELRDENPS